MGRMRAAAVLGIETNYISGCCEVSARAAPWPSIISSLHTLQTQRAGFTERDAACALESAGRDVSGCLCAAKNFLPSLNQNTFT